MSEHPRTTGNDSSSLRAERVVEEARRLVAKWRKDSADNYGGCGTNSYVDKCADELDALLASQEAAPLAQWQDIETAPKDTPVLTYRGAGLMAVAEDIADPREPHSGKREWCCTDGVFLLNVTHWMPLPAPPAQEGSPR